MGFMVLPFLFPPKLDFGIAGPEEAKNLAGKDPAPVSDPFSETNFEEISPARQAQLPPSANRQFQFNKRSQFFIRSHNKALSNRPSVRWQQRGGDQS